MHVGTSLRHKAAAKERKNKKELWCRGLDGGAFLRFESSANKRSLTPGKIRLMLCRFPGSSRPPMALARENFLSKESWAPPTKLCRLLMTVKKSDRDTEQVHRSSMRTRRRTDPEGCRTKKRNKEMDKGNHWTSGSSQDKEAYSKGRGVSARPALHRQPRSPTGPVHDWVPRKRVRAKRSFPNGRAERSERATHIMRVRYLRGSWNVRLYYLPLGVGAPVCRGCAGIRLGAGGRWREKR